MPQRLSTRRLADMTVNMACNSFEMYKKTVDWRGEKGVRRQTSWQNAKPFYSANKRDACYSKANGSNNNISSNIIYHF